MEIWEAMERENHVTERGLVPVNGSSNVQVQNDHGGAKMDSGFVHRGQSCRYASTDIPSDLLVKVGGVNFHLHKHPMISRCGRLARLVDEASALHGPNTVTVVELPDLPGCHAAFELAAKFCYGVAVGITAGNVAALRCAAEYLEMTDEMEEGNLASRAEAFLSYVVASSWRDSVAVLRSCGGGGGDGEMGLSPWADDLQLVRRCAESVAAKACTNPRVVRWPYGAGGRSRTPSPARPSSGYGGGGRPQPPPPPPDWWVDDVCTLRIEHFVRVVTAVQAKGMRAGLVGAAITRYATKWLGGVGLNDRESPAASRAHGSAPWPARSGGALQMEMVVAGEGGDTEMASEQRMVVESLISIIPRQKDSVSCSFLLRLLRLAAALKAAPALVTEVEKLAGAQLDQAALADILVPSSSYPYAAVQRSSSTTAYDVDLVQRLVEQFVVQEQWSPSSSSSPPSSRGKEKEKDSTRAQRVVCLVDGYLLEVSRDRNLALGKFQAVAESVPESARPCHDALYHAIDAYLKAHPAAGEHERKRLCMAVDCGRLSREARAHAARNERLPVRVAVRVLLSEQEKMAGRVGRKEEGEVVAALRMEVESVSAKYMELQREVELLQRQVERLMSSVLAGKQQQQQSVSSGWASGWKKLGRLGRIQVEQQPAVMAAAAPGETVSREPRRRRNSAS
ncbi:unnamed protein product [Urochloa humidicola]